MYHGMRLIAAFIVTFLTIPGLAFADADPWGNEYPAVCTREASIAAAKKLTVIAVSNLPIQRDTSSRCGFYDDRFDPPLIYVLKVCTVGGKPISRADVLHHEGCHALKPRGDPRWHD